MVILKLEKSGLFWVRVHYTGYDFTMRHIYVVDGLYFVGCDHANFKQYPVVQS